MKAKIHVEITVEREDGWLIRREITAGRWYRLNRQDERYAAQGRIDWMVREAVRAAIDEARSG